MKTPRAILFMLGVFVLSISRTKSDDEGLTLERQVRKRDTEVRHLKSFLLHSERKLIDRMDLYEVTLGKYLEGSVLPGLVDDKVREVIEDLVKDKTLDNLLNNQMMEQMRDLKRRHNEIKRQQQRMSREISLCRRDNELYRDEILKNHGNKINNLETRAKEFLISVSNVSMKVKELEGDNSHSTKTLRDEIGKVKRRMALVENNATNLEAKITRIHETLNVSIVNMKMTTSNLKSQVDMFSARITNIDAGAIDKNLSFTKRQIERVEEDFSNLTKKYEDIEHKLSNMDKTLSIAMDKNNNLEKDVSKLNDTSQKSSSELERLLIECATVKEEAKEDQPSRRSRMPVRSHKTNRTHLHQVNRLAYQKARLTADVLQDSGMTCHSAENRCRGMNSASYRFFPRQFYINTNLPRLLISADNPNGKFSTTTDGRSKRVYKLKMSPFRMTERKEFCY